MRKRAPAVALLLVSLSGCWSTDPDYVAETRGPQCDVRSQLVRRGYPENLDAVLAGSCTVTRMDPMRGPDFTFWLAGASSAIMSCDSPVRIPFWTEKSPEGKITKVHFCPEYCIELRQKLMDQIAMDLICNDGGVALPPSSGAVAAPPDAGTSFVFPIAGYAAPAAMSGGAGGGAAGTPAFAGAGGALGVAGSAALAGVPAVAGAAGTAGVAGSSGLGGAGGS